jgi:death-on-curing protein
MRYVALSEVLALHRAVSLNHPFVDGNKRVAHAAMEVFLLLNGYGSSRPSTNRSD